MRERRFQCSSLVFINIHVNEIGLLTVEVKVTLSLVNTHKILLSICQGEDKLLKDVFREIVSRSFLHL
jgi:hypothetical protein